ncbi:hypothetical protein ACU686_32740 [Yinghuangia aomiensis]
MPLRQTVADDTPVRDAGIFGAFGGHVSVTDGRYVYMRACIDPSNTPLSELTLMPTRMAARFTPSELAGAELVPGGTHAFTKGAPVLKVPGFAISPAPHGTLMFDLDTDPGQDTPLVDDALELRLIGLLLDAMRAADAPAEQYARLGLPQQGPAGNEHLLARVHRAQAEAAADAEPLDAADFPTGPRSVNAPLRDLFADEAAVAVLRDFGLGRLIDGGLTRMIGDASLIQLSGLAAGLLGADVVRALSAALVALDTADTSPTDTTPAAMEAAR